MAEAVGWLESVMPEADLESLATMEGKYLVLLHSGLGTYVRNSLGLWGNNEALMKDAGARHEDEVSAVITVPPTRF